MVSTILTTNNQHTYNCLFFNSCRHLAPIHIIIPKMYLAKILLLSTTISMVTALPMVGGGGPTGNNSQEQQCREDLQGLNTSLSNASAAQAEIDAVSNNKFRLNHHAN